MTAPSTRAHAPRANGLTSPASAPSPEQSSVPVQSNEGTSGDVFPLTRLDLLVVGLLGALVALGTLAVLTVGALVVEGMVGRWRTSMGMGMGMCVTGDVTHALRSVGADASEDGTGRGTPIVTSSTRVRRLTPRECERLQGFPDDHTAIGKDSPRYAALGNSMAVPVMRWIGERIARVDSILEAA